jgi:hypothetical protein
MIGSSITRPTFKVRSPGPHKATSVSTHNDDLGNFAQLKILSPVDARGLPLIACMVNELTCTKSKGFPSDITFYPYTCYTCNASYKKEGAPDQCPILFLYFLHAQCCILKVRCSRSMSHSILIHFTCVVPRTKNKGSHSMSHSTLILFYTRIIIGSRLEHHYNFHTHSSSTYEKHGASIYIQHMLGNQ